MRETRGAVRPVRTRGGAPGVRTDQPGRADGPAERTAGPLAADVHGAPDPAREGP